jgi:hypothetical protein
MVTVDEQSFSRERKTPNPFCLSDNQALVRYTEQLSFPKAILGENLINVAKVFSIVLFFSLDEQSSSESMITKIEK